jgi:hypothetical protein
MRARVNADKSGLRESTKDLRNRRLWDEARGLD